MKRERLERLEQGKAEALKALSDPNPSGIAPTQFKICTAPAGGCGFGPRRRVLTQADHCACGSPYRLARDQSVPPQSMDEPEMQDYGDDEGER